MAKNTPITQQVKDEIRKLHQQGVKQIEIARRLNLSRSTIGRVIGPTVPVKRDRVTQDDIAKIWELRGQMMPVKEIAQIVGVSPHTAARIARQKYPDLVVRRVNGTESIYKRGLHEITAEMKQQIIDLVPVSHSIAEIARVMGISRYSAAHILRENGVKVVKPKKELKNRITKHTAEKWKKTVKAGKELSSENKLSIKELFLCEGVSRTGISRRLNISYNKVSEALNEMGIDPDERPKLKLSLIHI